MKQKFFPLQFFQFGTPAAIYRRRQRNTNVTLANHGSLQLSWARIASSSPSELPLTWSLMIPVFSLQFCQEVFCCQTFSLGGFHCSVFLGIPAQAHDWLRTCHWSKKSRLHDNILFCKSSIHCASLISKARSEFENKLSLMTIPADNTAAPQGGMRGSQMHLLH